MMKNLAKSQNVKEEISSFREVFGKIQKNKGHGIWLHKHLHVRVCVVQLRFTEINHC